MSALTIRIPDSLHRKIKEVAKQDGTSLNQFICSAAAEKLSAVLTIEYLKDKAKSGNIKDFDALLNRLPDHEPLDWDRM